MLEIGHLLRGIHNCILAYLKSDLLENKIEQPTIMHLLDFGLLINQNASSLSK